MPISAVDLGNPEAWDTGARAGVACPAWGVRNAAQALS